MFDEYDHRHLVDKFPMVDPSIHTRLAVACTQRRRELKAAERRPDKFSHGIDDVSQGDEHDAAMSVQSFTAVSRYYDPDTQMSDVHSLSGGSNSTSIAASLFTNDVNLTISPSP